MSKVQEIRSGKGVRASFDLLGVARIATGIAPDDMVWRCVETKLVAEGFRGVVCSHIHTV